MKKKSSKDFKKISARLLDYRTRKALDDKKLHKSGSPAIFYAMGLDSKAIERFFESDQN